MKHKQITSIKFGLNSFQLKIIATICMTIDHLPSYFFSTGFMMEFYNCFRIIGRIAAPLFLYVLVSGVHYSRNKKHFLLRVYLANLAMTAIISLLNILIGNIIGKFTTENIFPTYTYTIFYIIIIENLIKDIRLFKWSHIVGWIFIGVGVPLIAIIYYTICDQALVPVFLKDILYAVLPNPLLIQYSMAFPLIGVIWYFQRTKMNRIILFIVASLICYYVIYNLHFLDFYPFNDFFTINQYWMILSVPFMGLYNGKRGKNNKAFFYIYYPTHIYFLRGLSLLLHV